MQEVKRVFKYGVVGVTGTIIDLLVLFVLVEFAGIHVMLATTISFVFAATSNFIWNKIWTFKNKNKAYHHQYLKFLIVSIGGLIITIFFMFIIHVVLRVWYITAKIITSLLVLSWNYWGNKNWTFRPVEPKIYPDIKYDFDYSIVIPAYNEENRIINTLISIEKFLKEFDAKCEIIVVNDGSTDGTVHKIASFKSPITIRKIDLEQNHGKGYAIRTGIEKSHGKYILFTDADNATPIEELNQLRKYIKDYDIVIGSRKLNASVVEIKQPFYRKIISKIGSLLSTIIIKDIKDTQCGFKLIKHQVAQDIFSKQQIKRFGFDIEFLAVAQFYDFKILEVPIRWRDNKSSSFRPITDTFLTLRDFLIIQYNFLTKKY